MIVQELGRSLTSVRDVTIVSLESVDTRLAAVAALGFVTAQLPPLISIKFFADRDIAVFSLVVAPPRLALAFSGPVDTLRLLNNNFCDNAVAHRVCTEDSHLLRGRHHCSGLL